MPKAPKEVNTKDDGFVTAKLDLDGKLHPHDGPKLGGNFFSRLTFWPATPLVRTGAKAPVTHDKLWSLQTQNTAQYTWRQFKPYWKEELALPPGQASLFRATARTFAKDIALCIFLQLAYACLSFLTPVLLPYMLLYINPTTPAGVVEDAWGYIYGLEIVLAQITGSFVYYHSLYRGWVLGLKIRSILTQVTYRKAIVTPSSRDRNTGNITNMISSDAQLISDTIVFVLQGVIAPVQIIVCTGLLWQYLGAYALIPLGVLIITFPITAFLARRIGALRMIQQLATDDRVKLVKELISAIRIVKYYAWERPFAKNITKYRTMELERVKNTILNRAIMIGMMINVPGIGMGLTFFIFALNNTLNVTNVFTSVSLMNLLRLPFTFLPMLVAFITQYMVSFQRIAAFCLSRELPEREGRPVQDIVLEFKNASFSWEGNSAPAAGPHKDKKKTVSKTEAVKLDETSKGPREVLKDINLKVKRGEVVMIIGSVGSGKSSMISAALGEITTTKGSVELNGSIAYVPQEAWIINATMRDNILFGQPYDEKRYNEVVRMSALAPDFKILAAGDLTEIGGRGVNLSGGQRQRVSIARALYSERDVAIFDDPFSAVDSHVAAHLVEHAIARYIRENGKTGIIVTNQLQFLPVADRIVLLKGGKIAEQGTFEQLKSNGKAFAELIAEFGIIESKKQEEPEKQEKPKKDNEDVKNETRNKDQEAADLKKGNLTGEEEKEEGNIGFSIYWYYITAGSAILFFLGLLIYALAITTRVYYSIWLSDWSSTDPAVSGRYTQWTWLGVYIGLVVFEGIMLFLRFIISVYWSRNASHRLHKDIMAKLVRATTTFYDVTPMGRLLTRISKDIAMIDQMLSNQFDTTVNMVFNLLGTFAQMATSSPYILIIVGVAVIVFYFLQAYYRKTSIEIQRLESISRAPILGHLSETLEGAQNIRAYGMERNFKYANFNKIDDNTVDFLALRYSSMWFGLRLDFLGTCIIFATFLSIILLRNLNPAALTVSLAGLAMSSTTGITFMLSALSMNMAELETRMNSVERIQQYTKIEQEAPAHIEETAPPASWPEKGEIKFKGLSIAYNGGPKVLKQLSIKIRPREKVGIVGRTGAGKSTLITALFRLVEFVEGTAFIDGVDISKIGLDDLRRKISIIPQMPQLFIGTVRYNVDPFAAATDDQIWKALEMVQLKDYIASLDGKLEAQIDEGGANLSVGQRQLLSMARALLVNAHILLLDEATASADSETDAVIQRMIRREFNDKTILCIAHRLNTIMDYDRIVVMSAGEVVEYDTPANLLKNPDGVFTSMVNATGEASAAHLKKIANGEINVVEDIKAEAQKEKAKRDKKQNGSSNGSKPKKSSSKKIKEIIESSSDESSS